MTIDLGRFGLWTSYHAIGEENAADAARLAERLGYATVWVGGSPTPAQVTPMLEATQTLRAATGIVNVWQSQAAATAREQAQLAARFPDRFMMGIGVGHPEATSDYRHPLRAMGAFLDELDATEPSLARDGRCLAALGPKMLDLAAERTAGTHTYFVVPEHTAFARERLGSGRLIAVEVACVLDDDVERARATARGYAEMYLGLRNYTNNLKRFGFTDEDIANGGSDRLIDQVIPHGSAQDIAAAVRRHLDAGADHVCLQTVGVRGVPEREWSQLAQALELAG